MTDRGLFVLAPRMCQSTSQRAIAGPQVWFRVVHIAAGGHHRAPCDGMCEQTVEITLGPKGTFKKGNTANLRRQVSAGRIVNTLSQPRPERTLPKEPKTPRIVELLRTAMDWQRQLDAGEVHSQAEIARREGITRARVTQVMGLLRLAPAIKEHLLALPGTTGRAAISERALRAVVRLERTKQRAVFRALIARS